MSNNLMAIDQAHTEQSVIELPLDYRLDVDVFFVPHVKISGSDSVTKTVCSKWAES